MTQRSILLFGAVVGALAWPRAAAAQAPPTAPIVLTQPPSARSMALGGAWVAGRDTDVVFTNPAQLVGVRTDFSATYSRPDDQSNGLTLSSAYSGGKMSFTLGWGIQGVNTAPPSAEFFSSSAYRQTGVAVIAGAVQYKSIKIGASAKYAADRAFMNNGTFLVDVGAARALFGGTVAVVMQNIGRERVNDFVADRIPRQIAGGWSRSGQAGPLDLTLFTQASHRSGWNSAAAGLEAGYSWIEGMSVTARVGVRRPELLNERPVSLGGAFTADRLTLEYAVRMFTGNHYSHVVTIRWR